MRTFWLLQSTLVLPALLVCACGGDETCVIDNYPAAPDGSAVLHVSAGCPADSADGSAQHPYATITQALTQASAGTAILIAPGTYAESLKITKDVTLVGSSDPTSADAAAVVLQAPAGYPIEVTAAQNVRLRGLRMTRPVSAGLVLRTASVTMEGCVVDEVQPSSDGQFGYGVVATDDASIILQNSAITAAAGIGVLVSQSRGIILQNSIRGGGGPGIRLDAAIDEVRIEANLIEGNAQMGIGVFSSKAIILQNVIRQTVVTGTMDMGDGIVVGSIQDANGTDLGPADVTISDSNEIEGNGRTGVLFAGGTRGIILQNNIIQGNGTVAGFGAGVWLQQGAGGDPANVIEGNQIMANKFVGIGMIGQTHGIILQNNQITATLLGDAFVGAQGFSIGDGINLLQGASARVLNNTVSTNGRMGLVLDDADGSSTTLQGNSINDNEQYGIILQNQPVAPATTTNTFQGNKVGDVNQVAAGTFAVPTQSFTMP